MKNPSRLPHLLFGGVLSLLMLMPSLNLAQVQERFPKPDFQSGYVRPDLITPTPRSQALEYLDVFVLLAALSLATYFAHKLRSRRKLFLLMVFSLIYFGFFRKGCVCSIGAIQNVGLAIFDNSYAVPLTVLIFFILPLLFALFFGRTFCAAVCPLGAMQDAVVLKPTKVPAWLAEVLGVLPYIYLGLAVLFVATGAGFIICQYDPFIGFFRFGASFNMMIFGACILILGTVVARPYCRFLCPYGVLLNWMSRLSRWHVKITPTECNKCRLCEESCPFGAIKTPHEPRHPGSREKTIRNLAVLLVLLPVLVVGGGWIVSRLDKSLSRQHFTVALAEQILLEEGGQSVELTEETKAYRASGKPREELFQEAAAVQRNFRLGGWILGAFIGLILGLKLLNLTVLRRQLEYDVDTGTCLSCGRCFMYCPFEHVRLGLITPEEAYALGEKNPEPPKNEGGSETPQMIESGNT
jgi:polyferredoxin